MQKLTQILPVGFNLRTQSNWQPFNISLKRMKCSALVNYIPRSCVTKNMLKLTVVNVGQKLARAKNFKVNHYFTSRPVDEKKFKSFLHSGPDDLSNWVQRYNEFQSR